MIKYFTFRLFDYIGLLIQNMAGSRDGNCKLFSFLGGGRCGVELTSNTRVSYCRLAMPVLHFNTHVHVLW